VVLSLQFHIRKFTVCSVNRKQANIHNINVSGGKNYKKLGGAECSYIAGTRTVRKAYSEHAKHALFLGGSGGMPPQENFENKCYEIESGGNFG